MNIMRKINLKQLSLAIVITLSAQPLLAMDAPAQEIAEKPVLKGTNIAYGATNTITTFTPPNIAQQAASHKFKHLPLPKDLMEIVLNECQGSFNNVSLVCKDFLRLTNKLTTTLNSKDNWVFKIFQLSPSLREEDIFDDSYLDSLVAKKKITYLNVKESYPVFTKFFTRFKNLTSLDLHYANLSNPTISQVSFFTENSLKQLTNLQFLRIHQRYFHAPRAINSENPGNTQKRLSILTEQLKKLTNLSILICPGNILTDDILTFLTKLRNLDLSKNELVTNEGLKHTSSSLEYLCLGENQSISPQTLQFMTKLVFLDIYNNKQYTTEHILSIPSLKILFANLSKVDINSGFHNLQTLECSKYGNLPCGFKMYLKSISSNLIGDPYKKFVLELEEKSKNENVNK